jgi:hypothetical protein
MGASIPLTGASVSFNRASLPLTDPSLSFVPAPFRLRRPPMSSRGEPLALRRESVGLRGWRLAVRGPWASSKTALVDALHALLPSMGLGLLMSVRAFG